MTSDVAECFVYLTLPNTTTPVTAGRYQLSIDDTGSARVPRLAAAHSCVLTSSYGGTQVSNAATKTAVRNENVTWRERK